MLFLSVIFKNQYQYKTFLFNFMENILLHRRDEYFLKLFTVKKEKTQIPPGIGTSSLKVSSVTNLFI